MVFRGKSNSYSLCYVLGGFQRRIIGNSVYFFECMYYNYKDIGGVVSLTGSREKSVY